MQRKPLPLFCLLDFESYSEEDLTSVGAYKYSIHPSTEITHISWFCGTREEILDFLKARKLPYLWCKHRKVNKVELSQLERILLDPQISIIAHNSFFEMCMMKFCLSRRLPSLKKIPINKFMCTASMAAALAIPRKLEDACLVLDLPVKKDMEGNRLMKKYSKPKKPSKNDPSTRYSKIEDLERIGLYCQRDIIAEAHLFLRVPELNPLEREIWLLDQKINLRGVKIDVPLIHKILEMINIETAHLNIEFRKLTNLKSATQNKALLQWLKLHGYKPSNVQAKTIEDTLKLSDTSPLVKRVLEIRQMVAKTSTAKYIAFLSRVTSDGRIRDNLMYHAASTGRWGGKGLNLQNMPRPLEDLNTLLAVDILKECDLETVRLIYGQPMAVFSSCIRNMIVVDEDQEMFCSDFAAIEARELFWIAEHFAGLKAFANDEPMYEKMASVIYNRVVTKKDKFERQVGKQAVLGCGYMMGHKKFKITCEKYGIIISDKVAKKAVNAYRETHKPIPLLWNKIQKAAICAVKKPGFKFTINKTTWWVENNFLWCELPSKRKLAYYKPIIKMKPTPWGEMRDTLYHWGMENHQWVLRPTYGGKLVENIVQAVSRDLMAEAMLRIEKNGYKVLFHSHDEIVAAKEKYSGELKNYNQLMCEIPKWAAGSPIKVEGWIGQRYHK